MMIILIPGFLFSDFKRLAHYIEKRMKRRKIYQVGCGCVCTLQSSSS